jgi:hypothetical protein
LIRQDPKSFIPSMINRLNSFDSLQGGRHRDPVLKGKKKVQAALDELERLPPIEPLIWNDCLALAAK